MAPLCGSFQGFPPVTIRFLGLPLRGEGARRADEVAPMVVLGITGGLPRQCAHWLAMTWVLRGRVECVVAAFLGLDKKQQCRIRLDSALYLYSFISFSRAASLTLVVSTSMAFSSSSTGGRLGAMRRLESVGSF